jgi:HK97 family phage prohead protease
VTFIYRPHYCIPSNLRHLEEAERAERLRIDQEQQRAMVTRRLPASGQIAHRKYTREPPSYDPEARTAEVTISTGVPVKRFYGVEELEISRAAVDLTRISAGIPVLDSHSQASIMDSLGKLTRAWIEDGALVGEIKFHATPEGKKAEGMVSRGEIQGCSAGYLVSRWEVRNEDDEVVDPDKDRVAWDAELRFIAKRWSLHEVSLVAVPADATAQIRSMPDSGSYAAAKSEMAQSIHSMVATRQRLIDDIEKRFGRRHGNAAQNIRVRMQMRQRMMERKPS